MDWEEYIKTLPKCKLYFGHNGNWFVICPACFTIVPAFEGRLQICHICGQHFVDGSRGEDECDD